MPRTKRIILIVEDSPDDRFLLRRYLEQDAEADYEFVETDEGKRAATLCVEHTPDCILLDYRLPDMDGLDVLSELQRACDQLPPVVFLTNQGDEYLAVQAMKSGASDYLSKGRLTPDFLRAAVVEAIARGYDTQDTKPTMKTVSSIETRVVDGRYQLEDQGQRGGMGTVFAAYDHQTEQKVALKLLRRPSDNIRHRFRREIRVLATLHHPSIVRYLNHGTTEDGDLYLVMAWLEGLDLAHHLARNELSTEETMILGMRVSEALHAAHAKGLVHRDIKPSNLFLRDEDVRRIALIDFGVVHDANSGTFLTGTGLTVGTPGYMAPEQVLDDVDVDHRADIFALGCVMYRCLTGQPYFAGRNVVAVMAKLVDSEYDSRSLLHEGEVSVELASLVSRMLSRNPDERPESADMVAQELRALLPSREPSP